ncbi:S-layer family protein [Natranaerovirga hydrolytica]|uniref:S-layer family protein n=1 Tax=Natranaerovirga hydrolytica TaxID=680378 RepID=A0A4R1M9R1_9FIRM|nr:cyclophilin-like fold protein [Natranaerovirga hydrolytica]TCK89096.1 S-layer family protein [Natranaerovirga hydrolytica]
MFKYRSKLSILLALVISVVINIPAFAAVEDTGFSDVAADAWYADAAVYCRDNGLMSGTSATTFSPNSGTSRAMLATILYRQAGSPAVTETSPFTDVSAGAWYSNAVVWAATNNIVSGYGNGLFGTNDSVTREQFAAILWRNAGSPSVSTTPASFADESTIASYAATAVDWAQQNGIVSGKPNNLFDPKGNVTRAETAVMLHRYLTMEMTPLPELPELPEEPIVPEEPTVPDENTEMKLSVQIGQHTFKATLEDNTAVDAFVELMKQEPVVIQMSEYGGFEKVGSLGQSLPSSSRQTTTQSGDIVLYNGNQIVIFYGSNSWSYTRLGRIDDLSGWTEALGRGDVTVTFSIQ